MEEKKKRDGLLEYASIVQFAVLESKCKLLLWHYAYGFNWTKKKPSFYSQRKICLYTGMSPSSYQKARKRLLELGWIIEFKSGRRQPVLVTPKVGRDDEKIVSRFKIIQSEKMSLDEAIRSLPDEFTDPFWDEGQAAS